LHISEIPATAQSSLSGNSSATSDETTYSGTLKHESTGKEAHNGHGKSRPWHLKPAALLPYAALLIIDTALYSIITSRLVLLEEAPQVAKE